MKTTTNTGKLTAAQYAEEFEAAMAWWRMQPQEDCQARRDAWAGVMEVVKRMQG